MKKKIIKTWQMLALDLQILALHLPALAAVTSK